jgi:hypothetical protein
MRRWTILERGMAFDGRIRLVSYMGDAPVPALPQEEDTHRDYWNRHIFCGTCYILFRIAFSGMAR